MRYDSLAAKKRAEPALFIEGRLLLSFTAFDGSFRTSRYRLSLCALAKGVF